MAVDLRYPVFPPGFVASWPDFDQRGDTNKQKSPSQIPPTGVMYYGEVDLKMRRPSVNEPLELTHDPDDLAHTGFQAVVDDIRGSVGMFEGIEVARSVLSFSAAFVTTAVGAVFFFGALNCFGRGAWVAERAGCMAACPAASCLLVAAVHVALALLTADLCHEFQLALPLELPVDSGSWADGNATEPGAGGGGGGGHPIRVPAFDRIFRCATGHDDSPGFAYLHARVGGQLAAAHAPGCRAIAGLCADVAGHHLHESYCSPSAQPCSIATVEQQAAVIVLTERAEWSCSTAGCGVPAVANWTLAGCAASCTDGWLREAAALAAQAVEASLAHHRLSKAVLDRSVQPLLSCTFWRDAMRRLHQPVCYDSVLGFLLVAITAVLAAVAVCCATLCVATAGKRLDRRRHHFNTPFRPPLDVDAIIPHAAAVDGRLRWQDLTNLANLPSLAKRMPITPLVPVDDDVRPATPVSDPEFDARHFQGGGAEDDKHTRTMAQQVQHLKRAATLRAAEAALPGADSFFMGLGEDDEHSVSPPAEAEPPRTCCFRCCRRRKRGGGYDPDGSTAAWGAAFDARSPPPASRRGWHEDGGGGGCGGDGGHMHDEYDDDGGFYEGDDGYYDDEYYPGYDDDGFDYHNDNADYAAVSIQAAFRGASVRWRLEDQRAEMGGGGGGGVPSRRGRRAAGPATLAMAKHAVKQSRGAADVKQLVRHCRCPVVPLPSWLEQCLRPVVPLPSWLRQCRCLVFPLPSRLRHCPSSRSSGGRAGEAGPRWRERDTGDDDVQCAGPRGAG